MLTLAYYLHCLLTVAAAVCFADLLVQDGMLLAPVQRWVREWYRKPFRPKKMLKNPGWPEYWPEYVQGWGAEVSKEIDDQMWWKPLWGCPTCVAGWWALVAYVVHYHGPAYCWYEHIYFVAIGLLFSLLLQWIIQRLQS